MASSTLAPAHAILAVQRTVRALYRVTQNLNVFRAELEERAQPMPRMIRTPSDLAASILADRSRMLRALSDSITRVQRP